MRSSRHSSRRAARLALPVAALVGLTGLVAPTTAAAAPPLNANCDTTVGDPSISSFLTHEEVERRLAQIERTSKGTVDVDVAGLSNDDREIWSARVGTGAIFLLTEEPRGRGLTDTVAGATMLAWAVGALLLGWLRLVRDDATR